MTQTRAIRIARSAAIVAGAILLTLLCCAVVLFLVAWIFKIPFGD